MTARASSPDDFEFVLREWRREPGSASGRWFEYELLGQLGRSVGGGDTCIAAVNDATLEYVRKFERLRAVA